MSRTDGNGQCEHCGESFPYYLVHNGFNESAYSYCGQCGQTALLDGWRIPKEFGIEVHQHVSAENEVHLQPCSCGGRFLASASPRCPLCHAVLSPVEAANWIERNAKGTAGGWRWQRSWQGLYAIVIDNRVVANNWREPKCAI